MAITYNTKDISLQRKAANGRFEEYKLSLGPNQFLMTDGGNNVITVSGSDAVFNTTGSWTLNAVAAINSQTASYVNGTYASSSYISSIAINSTRITASFITSSFSLTSHKLLPDEE